MAQDKAHDEATAPGTMPPDNGVRASTDPETGAVRGSGVGTGGGSAGEDLSSDAAGGDGTDGGQRAADKRP